MKILITGAGSLVGSQTWRFVFLLYFLLFQIFPGHLLLASEIVEDAVYDQLLKKVTGNKQIDADALNQGRHILDVYLDSYKQVDWLSLSSHPREEQISFWINGYNAVMLKVLSETSADKLPSIDDPAFPNQYKLELKDKIFTLKELRDDILRRHYRDERIHFAILDGARNGPRLRPEAYTGAHLDVQLDEAIRGFIADQAKNRINPREKKLYLSYLFKDFGDDFLLNYASPENSHKKFTLSQLAVLSFIAQHSPEEVVKYLGDAKYKINYLPRDPWSKEEGKELSDNRVDKPETRF